MQPADMLHSPATRGRTADYWLTRRQQQVLGEYLLHASAEVAAECLGVSRHTVQNTLRAIREIIGTGTTLEAAMALGWVWFPPGTVRDHADAQ